MIRNLITFSIALLISYSTLATIRTVSNDPQNPAQYTAIQAAVDAAVAGDTIYVNASPNNYSENVNVTKQVVLIGGGYKSSNQLNYPTSVVGLYLQSASGTVVCGFQVSTISYSIGASNNIRIFRNNIGSISISGSNWSIYNNIISSSVTLGNGLATNTTILNNIFSVNGFISASTANTVVIDHNIFLRIANQAFNNIQFATITNNIFTANGAQPIIDGGTTSNNFNNNLSLLTNVNSTPPTNSFASGPNIAAGNFVGVDPLFVNVTDFGVYNANANYRLQSTSPAKNAGTDGTDLGIYGGSYPFPSGGSPGSGFDTSALPPIPQITSVNIQNGTLAPGAQLKVTIQATVNN